MLRNTLLTAVLALSSIGIASARSNEVILTHKTMVGNTVLRPGTYKVDVEGSNAVFKRTHSSKTYTMPATISDNDRQF